MKKFISILVLSVALLTACNVPGSLEDYKGYYFEFSYPQSYNLRKRATEFVLETQDGERALTIYRYIYTDTPQDVITQMNSVGQMCELGGAGATRYGGKKAYTVKGGDDCTLQGSLISDKKGMHVLFVEGDAITKELKNSVKRTFKFANPEDYVTPDDVQIIDSTNQDQLINGSGTSDTSDTVDTTTGE